MSDVAPAGLGFDAALAGAPCYVVGLTKRPTRLPIGSWRGAATESDQDLLDLCHGATLDIGCGPGRLAAALLRRRQPTLGIDVSRVAVAMARRRGVPALVRDVFGPVPGQGRWSCALLADGNIGIGGDPAALLRRVAEMLRPEGTVVADLAPPGTATRSLLLRLLLPDRHTRPFSWAVVGADAITPMASANGFAVEHLTDVDGRWVARLRRVDPPGRGGAGTARTSRQSRRTVRRSPAASVPGTPTPSGR